MKTSLQKFALLAVVLFSGLNSASAMSYLGRLGAGVSQQLANDLPALSFKVQTSRRTAFGGLVGVDANSDRSLYGFAGRVFRILFAEPHLNFYMAGTAGVLSYEQSAGQTETGFQVDASMGTEFSFRGIESLGFSFEFGLSVNNVGGTTSFQTLGQNFVQAAAHFYF